MGRIGLPQGFALQQTWIASVITARSIALKPEQRAWIATTLFENEAFNVKEPNLAVIAEMETSSLSAILAQIPRRERAIRFANPSAVAEEIIRFARDLIADFVLFRGYGIRERSMEIFIEQSGLQETTQAYQKEARDILMSDSPYKLTDRFNAPINPLWATIALEQLRQQ